MLFFLGRKPPNSLVLRYGSLITGKGRGGEGGKSSFTPSKEKKGGGGLATLKGGGVKNSFEAVLTWVPEVGEILKGCTKSSTH